MMSLPFPRLVLCATALLASTIAVIGQDQHQRSPANRSWPPGLLEVPPDSPALAPAEALKTFYMPPGYQLELVASEPLVKDPVAIDWDPDGRLWVVEMTGFVRDLNAPEPNLDRIGNLVVLEDTDRDGRMDKRTVFADGLVLPRALKVLDTGVLLGEPGSLWWMPDTNGDLRADAKELVTSDYGELRGSIEGNANGLYWGLDNWIHTSGGDVYLRLKHGKFEVRRTVLRGQWGISQDDGGRSYRNSNSSALHVDFVPGPYYARHPTPVRTRGSYDALRDDDDAINVVWPIRPNPGTNRAYQLGINRPDGTLNKFTAVCAPLVYRGDRLPGDLYGNVFLAEPAANLVSRIILEDTGTTLRARKAYENAEFLASTDERFRPVYLSNGPDGALYVVDFYRGILQDRASTTGYLRDYIVSHKMEQPIELGRIYRVVHESMRRDPPPRPSSKASATELVAMLSHANGWWRDTGQRLLVERGDRLRQADPKAFQSVVTALETLAGSSDDWRTRVHALWTLDGLDAIEPAAVIRALGDTSRDVRTQAVRIAERWIGEKAHPVQAAVITLVDDADWSVRQQVAATLGALPPGPRETAIADLLAKHGTDPVVMDAALSGVRGVEEALVERLLQPGVDESASRAAAITMTAALIVRSGAQTSAQNLFAWIADGARPEWQRSALLRGAEVALLGARMPGTPPPRAAALPAPPCPTCPGARSGPGGEYAFPGVREAQQAAAGRGGRGAGPALRLAQEPTALTALAAQGGELGTRAAAVVARTEWPGKPGAAAAAAPLSPADQQRFNAGRDVYRNVCQACHQPDGRGQDRVAPSLIGSDFTLGSPEILARIVLNGKEGPTGLMPPLGATMSDGDLAAVLTYIRREWGHTESAIDAETIGTVRAATAGRTRAWTNEELLKLPGAGNGQR
jgi:mono/diheme cytochrome c family protein/glucose/arabinose dehydrogenase